MEKSWFIRISDQTMGPVPLETVLGLLKNRRIGFADFAWREGLEGWTRLIQIEELAKYLPPVPDVPVPRGGTSPPLKLVPRAVRVPLRGHIVTPKYGKIEIVNVSQTGLLLRTTALLPLGTEIEFTIESNDLPQKLPDTILGRVSRHTDTAVFKGFGIEFTDIDEPNIGILKNFIAKAEG